MCVNRGGGSGGGGSQSDYIVQEAEYVSSGSPFGGQNTIVQIKNGQWTYIEGRLPIKTGNSLTGAAWDSQKYFKTKDDAVYASRAGQRKLEERAKKMSG